MAIDDLLPQCTDDLSSSSRSASGASLRSSSCDEEDGNPIDNDDDAAIIDEMLSLGHASDHVANPQAAADSTGHHPYLSHRSLSKSNFEAEHKFVNAMFDNKTSDKNTDHHSQRGASDIVDRSSWAQPSPSDSHLSFSSLLIGSSPHGDSMTPRSILMSQKLQQAHADAVLPQMSPMTPVLNVDLQMMPPLVLESQHHQADHRQSAMATRHGSSQTIGNSVVGNPSVGSVLDDEVVGRRLEKEIRKMMIRTHLTDEAPELAGMTEGPQELKRIGDALTRCMALRNKYMKLSLQREADNPRNSPAWKIYPPAPPPAWKNFQEPADSVSVEFDINTIDIPPADQCVFAMGDDGVYAVYESEELRASGAQPITSAPSIREFYMDLNFVLDTISDGPVKTWTYRRLRYLDARWQLYILMNEREETMQSKL
ncbi:AMP deaminase, partial [Coemansia erecta]